MPMTAPVGYRAVERGSVELMGATTTHGRRAYCTSTQTTAMLGTTRSAELP